MNKEINFIILYELEVLMNLKLNTGQPNVTLFQGLIGLSLYRRLRKLFNRIRLKDRLRS